MSLRIWFLLIVLSVLWGGSFFFTEIALEQVQVFMLVLLRVLIAALILVVFLLFSSQIRYINLKLCITFLIMGALNNVLPFCLIVWGQVYIDSGVAAILNATTPLFTVLLAHLWTEDEKLSVNKIIGVIAGFIGVVLLIGPGVFQGAGHLVWGQLAVLGAAVSYAIAGIWGKRLRELPIAVAATGMLTASSLMMMVVCLAVGELSLPQLSFAVWYAVLALAILSTALAYLIYFYILKSAGATNLLLVTFLIPVSALILGVFILDETITQMIIIGLVMILLGLLMIDGRIAGMFKKPT